jgi:hypothetical protein
MVLVWFIRFDRSILVLSRADNLGLASDVSKSSILCPELMILVWFGLGLLFQFGCTTLVLFGFGSASTGSVFNG